MKKRMMLLAMTIVMGCTTMSVPVLAANINSQEPAEHWTQEDISFWENYDWGEILYPSLIPDQELDHYGWNQDGTGWRYLYNDAGTKRFYAGAAFEIDGHTYAFDEKGYMMTGWISHIVPTGADAWKTEWYYAGRNGHMLTGWQKINGKWYYLGTDGVMKSGWQRVGGKWYYLGNADDGSMKSGWQRISGKWYYLGSKEDGAMKTGWQKVGNHWYYMYSSGEMAANTTIDGYHVDAQGRWVK